MQDMCKFMVHRLKVILIQNFDIDILKVQTVHFVQCYLLSSLGSTQHLRTTAIISRRTYQVKSFWHIRPKKSRSGKFSICLHPYMLDNLGQSNRFIVIRRYQIIFVITFNILHTILKINVIRICIISKQPFIKTIMFHWFC